VQFNPKDNQDALRQKLIATLGAAAGRLEKVPKQIDASVADEKDENATHQPHARRVATTAN